MGATEREIAVADHAAGGAAADPDRPAGGAAARADRRGGGGNADGRLRPRRRHDDGVALRQFAGVFAGIVEIAVVGYVLVKGMAMLRRRLLMWHQEANDPTTA